MSAARSESPDVDQGQIDGAVAELNRALRSHGGGIELVERTPSGALRLRMVGMCAGCRYRPMSTAATVRPFFRETLGLEVVVDGARISEEAEERLARALGHGPGDCSA
ncbi:MAG: NifU family protein [Aeromicrobium sp.]|nr:NifU family protein [Aeromicrobium sp.]